MPPRRTAASPERSRPSSRTRSASKRSSSKSPARQPAAAAVAAQKVNAVKLRKEELEKTRNAMSMRNAPFTVWIRFLQATFTFITTTLVPLAVSPKALVGYAVLGLYAWSRTAKEELYAPPTCGESGVPGGALFMPELYAYEFVWWLTLGILSSIGFGTGLHSGIMFLWPHVVSIIATADNDCASSNFAAAYSHPCVLVCASKGDGTNTFLPTFLRILPSVVIWGCGTAIGELPPYFITRAARRSGGPATDFDSELEEAKDKTDLVSWLKVLA